MILYECTLTLWRNLLGSHKVIGEYLKGEYYGY